MERKDMKMMVERKGRKDQEMCTPRGNETLPRSQGEK
jgi:hypothetical protein